MGAQRDIFRGFCPDGRLVLIPSEPFPHKVVDVPGGKYYEIARFFESPLQLLSNLCVIIMGTTPTVARAQEDFQYPAAPPARRVSATPIHCFVVES